MGTSLAHRCKDSCWKRLYLYPNYGTSFNSLRPSSPHLPSLPSLIQPPFLVVGSLFGRPTSKIALDQQNECKVSMVLGKRLEFVDCWKSTLENSGENGIYSHPSFSEIKKMSFFFCIVIIQKHRILRSGQDSMIISICKKLFEYIALSSTTCPIIRISSV